MPFSVNVLTHAGVELIAGATAANRLIFTRIRCTESAMTRAEAESADNMDFDMDDGDIISASAQDNVARVVGAIRAQSSYTAKTFGLCARLEGDASDRVFAVLSDPDRGIPLPGPVGGAPTASVSVAFQLAFTADASAIVNVTSAGAVAFHDLDRFMSAHKAGDTHSGDDQNIYGFKTFVDGLTVDTEAQLNGGANIGETAIFNSDIWMQGESGQEIRFFSSSPGIRFDNKAHVYGGIIFHGGLETGGGDIDTGIGTVYCGTLSVGNTLNVGDDDITYARGSHALYISGNVKFTCMSDAPYIPGLCSHNGATPTVGSILLIYFNSSAPMFPGEQVSSGSGPSVYHAHITGDTIGNGPYVGDNKTFKLMSYHPGGGTAIVLAMCIA